MPFDPSTAQPAEHSSFDPTTAVEHKEDSSLSGKLRELGTSIKEHPMQAIPGIAETIAGGIASIGETAVEGLAGLGTAAVGQGYEKGAEAAKKTLSGLPIAPETEVGKAASKVLGVIPETIHSAGEKVFEKTKSPLLAATTEAGLTALTLFPFAKGKALSKDSIKNVGKTPETIPEKVGMLQRIKNAEQGKVSDEPYTPNVTKIESTKDLAKALDWTQTSATADATNLRQNWENAKKAGYTAEQGKEFRNFSEGSTKELSPEKQLAYDMNIAPLKGEYENIIRQYKDFDLDKEIGARVSLGHRSFVDRVMSGDITGGFSRVGGKPSGMKARTVMALEDGTILTLGKENKLTSWKDGEATSLGSSQKRIKEGDVISGQKVVQAKQADIEAHTPIRYLNDDLAVWSLKLAEAKKYQRETTLLENLKESPFFKANSAIKGDKDVPADWRTLKGTEKLPQLQDHYFEPRTAEVFDDFISNNKGDRIGILEGINNISIKSFMINPLPHIMNEAAHWYIARGLSGAITPKGLKGLASSLPESISSVISQDKFQTDLLKNGAPLTYPNVANHKVWTDLFGEQLKSSEKNGTLAKLAMRIGTSPIKLFEAISQKTNAIMWASRDIMYSQLIKEHMAKGKTMQESIAQVGNHMPEYRLPSRVMGSRNLSQLMQNRNLTIFSRYHYGMLKSLGEIGKELKNPKSAIQGLDHLGALVAGMTILFPMFDSLYQNIFGKQDIRERRAGPFHLIQGVEDLAKGDKAASAIITSLLTPSPALVMGMELPFNVQLYSKQPIYQEGTSGTTIAADIAKYSIGKLLAPGQAAIGMKEGKTSPGEYALKQLDIESVNQRKKDRVRRMNEKKAKSYEKKMRATYGY